MEASISSTLSQSNADLLVKLNRPDLAYDLGVLSRILYKHYSAHRIQKYYGAAKKIDRNMCEYSSLRLFELLRAMSSVDVSNSVLLVEEKNFIALQRSLMHAYLLLNSVAENCKEVVIHSLPRIYLEFFLPLHIFLFALVSRISKCVQELSKDIHNWFLNFLPQGVICPELKKHLQSPKVAHHQNKTVKFKTIDNSSLKRFQHPTTTKLDRERDHHENEAVKFISDNSVDLGEVIKRVDIISKDKLVPEACDLVPLKRSNRCLFIKPYHVNFYKYCWQKRRNRVKSQSQFLLTSNSMSGHDT